MDFLKILHSSFSSPSSKRNTSSMEQSNCLAILNANFNDGLYFPVSIATIDCRETSTSWDNSSCVIFFALLKSLMRFFMKSPHFILTSYLYFYYNQIYNKRT